MLDVLTGVLTILMMIPIVYFSSTHFNNVFSLILLIFLAVPTIMAMVNGAPFVPTPMEQVKRMVALAKIKKGQRVYDIGCGDGRFVYIAANQYGANATGFELSPLVYFLALFKKLYWRSKAQILLADFKMRDLSDAEIIFCYLLPETLKKIQPNLDQQIKKGTRIYSYAFQIPSWKLIQTLDRDTKLNLAPVYVYEKA